MTSNEPAKKKTTEELIQEAKDKYEKQKKILDQDVDNGRIDQGEYLDKLEKLKKKRDDAIAAYSKKLTSKDSKKDLGTDKGAASLSKLTSQYVRSYTTFSGTDMVCTAEIPKPSGKGSLIQILGEVQTVSYSIHDEKTPVRCIGDMNPKAWIFGPRTVAGSIVFTVFDRHWAKKLQSKYLYMNDSHILSDELPPINLTISLANEYGHKARLAIYGITFVNEGQVMSINDMYTENTYQFYAMDVDYITPVYTSASMSGGSKKTPSTENKYPAKDAGSNKDNGSGKKNEPKKSIEPSSQSIDYGTSEKDGLKKLDEWYKKANAEVKEELDGGKITAEEANERKKQNAAHYKDAKKKIKEYWKKKNNPKPTDDPKPKDNPNTGKDDEKKSKEQAENKKKYMKEYKKLQNDYNNEIAKLEQARKDEVNSLDGHYHVGPDTPYKDGKELGKKKSEEITEINDKYNEKKEKAKETFDKNVAELKKKYNIGSDD